MSLGMDVTGEVVIAKADVPNLNNQRGRLLRDLLVDPHINMTFRMAGIGNINIRDNGVKEITDFKLVSINAVSDGA